MAEQFCCTCATGLSSIPPTYDEKTEKPARHERHLACCGRAICARCITDNPRFETYCPFCQVSSAPGPLPQGLRDPPAYSPPESVSQDRNGDEPPAYYTLAVVEAPREKVEQSAQDVLHFVHPDDTLASLSLRYGVPASALRQTNRISSDHLLAARRTVLIPGEYYKGGVSLSPRPVEGEEEEIRKGKVRKFMVTCKVSEYDVALLYLKQTDYNLDAAILAYQEDEKWEREHPLDAKSKGKNKSITKRKFGVGGGLSGQI